MACLLGIQNEIQAVWKIIIIFTGQLEDVVDAIENNLDHLGVFAAQ
jgi:hypothetical protein